MSQLAHQQNIVNYYLQCNNAYRDAWNLDRNMQLNLGLWKKGTKNLAEALQNLNREVAELAQIKATDVVLDAGCGVGGTAIYLAKNFGCKVVGITITPSQALQAIENAKLNGVEEFCTFKAMNYMHTFFDDESFDVVLGIESICYAEPKLDFLKEAKRLLKNDGRLILAENLQAKANLSPNEYQSLYTNAFNGCQVKSLDTAEQYLQNLKDLGFQKFACTDYTKFIVPSIKRLRRFYYPAALYNLVHRWMGKPFSQIQEANTKMCYHLLSSLNAGLWKYGIISAKK